MLRHYLGELVTYKASDIPYTKKDYYIFKWTFDYHDILYGYKVNYNWKDTGVRKLILEVINVNTGIKTIKDDYVTILTNRDSY